MNMTIAHFGGIKLIKETKILFQEKWLKKWIGNQKDMDQVIDSFYRAKVPDKDIKILLKEECLEKWNSKQHLFERKHSQRAF